MTKSVHNKKTKRWRGRGVVGFLRPALLFLLSRENAHGYSLIAGMGEFKFNTKSIDPSLVYRILREMENDGLISSQIGKESLGPKRKIYKLLPEGKTYLAELIAGLRRRRDEIDILLQTYDQDIK